MGRSIDDMLKELHSMDTKGNYEISFFCGRWHVRNIATGEGIDTDGEFPQAKRWLLKNMNTQ